MLLHNMKQPTEIHISHLNENVETSRKNLLQKLNIKPDFAKVINKLTHKKKKSESKVFVIDFKGDVQATAVNDLREEITLILAVANYEQDQVVVRLESPGGLVHGYGLAAAQLLRLRDSGLKVTICVDKVAASGGYMMACIAHQIIAAPFAVLGSIGVVAQMPNFNRFLKEHKIDYELFTAGEYKRTVTMFGENTEENKQKFEQELEQTHQLFKYFVEKYRHQLNIEQVATGEHWFGQDALKLNLIDKIATSDEYLLDLIKEHDVYLLYTRGKPTLGEKLGIHIAQVAEQVIPMFSNQVQNYLQKINFNRF